MQGCSRYDGFGDLKLKGFSAEAGGLRPSQGISGLHTASTPVPPHYIEDGPRNLLWTSVSQALRTTTGHLDLKHKAENMPRKDRGRC